MEKVFELESPLERITCLLGVKGKVAVSSSNDTKICLLDIEN